MSAATYDILYDFTAATVSFDGFGVLTRNLVHLWRMTCEVDQVFFRNRCAPSADHRVVSVHDGLETGFGKCSPTSCPHVQQAEPVHLCQRTATPARTAATRH